MCVLSKNVFRSFNFIFRLNTFHIFYEKYAYGNEMSETDEVWTSLVEGPWSHKNEQHETTKMTNQIFREIEIEKISLFSLTLVNRKGNDVLGKSEVNRCYETQRSLWQFWNVYARRIFRQFVVQWNFCKRNSITCDVCATSTAVYAT